MLAKGGIPVQVGGGGGIPVVDTCDVVATEAVPVDDALTREVADAVDDDDEEAAAIEFDPEGDAGEVTPGTEAAGGGGGGAAGGAACLLRNTSACRGFREWALAAAKCSTKRAVKIGSFIVRCSRERRVSRATARKFD